MVDQVENSYRFFRNTDCKYFPCHNVEDSEEFNCMFCYCPLYLLDDCGGKYVINNGVKDCSNCLIPHRPKGYDYILNKLIEANDSRKQK
ncbi:MAG: cysteine-rich small domain-containing protein [Tissierellaceae bacterium]